jgi:ubiquitin-protein ligase
MSKIKNIKETKTMTIKSQKRLLKDVVSIMKNDLSSQGIFYRHDENNFLNGYAMIFGPKDTPYENGVYLFSLKFPYNYPFSPPKLTYLTNDGKTRFNPNLYRGGKVCLSVLNTWKGEQWTSCQSISSILLTLVTVLNENPLINEPGISIKNKEVKKYNEIIKFKNISVAINDVLEKKLLPVNHKPFFPIIKKFIKEKKGDITSFFENNIRHDGKRLVCRIYNMDITLKYIKNFERFKKICNDLDI